MRQYALIRIPMSSPDDENSSSSFTTEIDRFKLAYGSCDPALERSSRHRPCQGDLAVLDDEIDPVVDS